MSELENNQLQCTCPWDCLLLKSSNEYNSKSINKASNKIINIIKASGLNHPKDAEILTLIQWATDSLQQKSKHGIAITHTSKCEQLKPLINKIRERMGLTASEEIAKVRKVPNIRCNKGWEKNVNADKTLAECSTTNANLKGSGPDDNWYKQEMESIRRHYYRKMEIQFRCQWKGFEIETTEDVDGILKFPTAAKQYLRQLPNRSIAVMIKRAPELAELLKKE